MVKICAVPICKSRSRLNPNVSFHEFPVDSRRSIWIENINRDNWTPTDCSFVCSLHFKESSFKSELKYKRLCPNAVPTLFLPRDYPTDLKPEISGEPEKQKMATERSAVEENPNVSDISESEESKDFEEDSEPDDLSCKKCGKSYRQLQHLKSHIALVHNQEKPTATETFPCEICNSSFRNSVLLKAHQQQKHEARNYLCKFVNCGRTYRCQNSLAQHLIKAHKYRKLQPVTVLKNECDICDKRFKLKKTLYQHKYKAHGDQLNTQCQFCRLGCLGLKGLQNHLEAFHSDQLNALKQKAAFFKCEICEKTFRTNKTLKEHRKNIHPVRINDVPSFDKQLIPCETCIMSFKSEVEKRKHRNQQKALTVIQCNYCLNTFHYKCQFYTHHQQYHQGKEPLLKCTMCEAYLTDYSLLQTHFWKCHSINPENSATCPSGAAIMASLSKDNTESEESGEVEENNEPEDLSCVECGKAYRQLQHLKSHIALAHNQQKPTAKETFTCEICNCTYKNATLLRAHIQQKHEARNYLCEFVTCGKTYRSESDLHRHQIKVHKVWKLKPITVHKHECEFCHKKFKLKKTMGQHRYIAHAKELNSQCQLCQTRCLGLNSLKNHLLICKKRFKRYIKKITRHQANINPVRINDVPSFDKEFIPCGTCNMSFRSEVEKTQHRNEQKALTVIQCNYCLNTFNYKCQFYTHHRQYHQEKKLLLKCTLCETFVTDYSLLQTHDWKCHSINPENCAASFFGSAKMSTEGDEFNNDSNTMTGDKCIDKNNVKLEQVEDSNLIYDNIVKVEPEDYQL